MQAVILGTVTGVGGGTLRDVLIRRVPDVLSSGLYAIPALMGAALAVLATSSGVHRVLGAPVALGAAAAVCFVIRMVGLYFGLDAPRPPGANGADSVMPVVTAVSRRARRGRQRPALGCLCPGWAEGRGRRRRSG